AKLVQFILTPYTRNAENEEEKCTGINDTVFIWVEPTTNVDASPETDTICDGDQTYISIQTTSNPTHPTEFRWRAWAENAEAVEVLPTGWNEGLTATSTINYTLDNQTDDVQRVYVEIESYTVDNLGNIRCIGRSDTVTVWVEPTTNVDASPEIDTICDGDQSNISIQTTTNPTRPTEFRWRAWSENAGMVALLPTGWNNGLTVDSTINFTLDNLSNDAQEVFFVVESYTVDNSGNMRCIGGSDTVIVWVEPTPRVTLTPLIDTICTSLRPSILLTTISRPLNPIRFRYEAIYDPANVEVYYEGSTTGLPPDYSIIDSIVNLTTTPQLVRFSVYPYLKGFSGIEKCGGIYDTADVWVAPTLIIMPDTISTYIGGRNIRCYGENNGFINLMPEGGIEAFDEYDVYDLNYEWSTSENTKDIAELTAGIYSVTVTDKLMCRDTASFMLTQPDTMIAHFVEVDTMSCLGSDGTLAVVVAGGTPDYLFYWYPWPAYHLGEGFHDDTLYNIVQGKYIVVPYDENLCKDSITIRIRPGEMTAVNMVSIPYGNGYHIRCHGDSTGRIWTETAYDGMMTYEWTGPAGFDSTYISSQKSDTLTGLAAGNYLLKYTDEIGCVSEGNEVYIAQPDPIEIEQSTVSVYNSVYNISCYDASDGSITLNHVTGGYEYGGYSYNWEILEGGSPVDTNQKNQENLKAGTYYVEISDIQGCILGDTFELVQPSHIQIAVDTPVAPFGTTNLNCFGDDNGYIELQVSGGEGPYTFNWKNGNNASRLNNLEAGTYEVLVTDHINCSVSDTIVLTEPSLLQIDSTDISGYNGYEIACAGDSNGYIVIFANGGAGSYTYDWTYNGNPLSADTFRLEDLVAGAYNLTITDENQCWTDTTLLMESPAELGLTVDTTFIDCSGDILGTARANVSGGVLPYTYSWSNADTTAYIVGLEIGNYWVTITDNNGCFIEDTIVINQDPTVEFDLILVKEITCYQGSDGVIAVNVTSGIPPFTYRWDKGNTQSSLSGVSEGEYTVMVTDNKGCRNANTIQVNDPERIIPLVTVYDALCFGSEDGEAELSATGGSGTFQFRWNKDLVSGTSVSGLAAGVYGIRVIDSRDCIADTAVTVGQPDEIIIVMDEDRTILPFCPDWRNGTLVITVTGGTPAYIYNWQDYPEINDPVLPDIKEGFYTISVTDQHNCYADTTFRLKSQNYTCLNIPTAFTPNNDGANDFWDVSYMNEYGEAPFYTVYPNGSIKIYDRWGTLVFKCENGCHDLWWGQDLKGRDLPSDSYHYIIELNLGDNRPPLKGAVTIIR
ncbi:MAG: gliding motility-associated C-terminal domain-containing protein, partial [Bacteroidales bacterium]|nr:gliding motility-associated C-terminal domain-containing protein [Bacteroidales bacterium]